MKKFSLLLGFLSTAFISFCQDSTKRKNLTFEITVFAGGELIQIGNLNQRLASLGVSKEKSFLLNNGLGLSYRINKVIIGYKMTILMAPTNEARTKGVQMSGYLSTNSIKTKNIIISPELGIGYERIDIKFIKPGTSASFNQYLTTTSNQVEIKNSNAMLDLGVTFKRFRPTNNLTLPFFRLGYKHGLKEKEWKIANGSSSDGPKDRLSSFYFHLMIGAGR